MNENVFFEKFTEKLTQQKFEDCATFFHLPCVVMNNKQKHVFNSASDITKWLSRYSQRLAFSEDENFGFKTYHSVNMSSKVRFVKVGVVGVEMKETAKKINISFTIANDEGEQMRIIVVVIDDV